MNKRTRGIALVVLLVVGVLLLSVAVMGCGSQTTTTTVAPATSTTGASGGTTTTAAPAQTTTTAGGKVVTLRMNTEWQPGDPRLEAAQKTFADPFNAQAKGFQIKIYASGELASALQTMDSIKTRFIDLAVTKLTGDWASVVPDVAVLGLSGLFADDAAAYAALDGALGKELTATFEKATGAKLLGYATGGVIDAIGCVPKEIKTAADLKGLKMNVSTKDAAAALEALGGVPTLIDRADLFVGLQRGTVEGLFPSTMGGAMSNKITEVCKNWTQAHIASGIAMGVVMSGDAWKELSTADQELLVKLTGDLRGALQTASEGAAAKAWAAVKDSKDLKYYELPADELAAWMALITPTQQKYLEQLVGAERAAELIGLATGK